MDLEELDRAFSVVPVEYRKVMARWLLARADWYKPSTVLSENEAALIQGVLTGIAVDVMDPKSEDMTTAHAARIIAHLQA